MKEKGLDVEVKSEEKERRKSKKGSTKDEPKSSLGGFLSQGFVRERGVMECGVFLKYQILLNSIEVWEEERENQKRKAIIVGNRFLERGWGIGVMLKSGLDRRK